MHITVKMPLVKYLLLIGLLEIKGEIEVTVTTVH